MDWLDLLAVQGTLKSHLQHNSLKASVLWRSAFFIIRLSHPHMTTGETRARTRRTFVGKVMFLLHCQVCHKVVCIRQSLQGKFKPPLSCSPGSLAMGVLSQPFTGQRMLRDAGKRMMMCPSLRLFVLKQCTQPVLSLDFTGARGWMKWVPLLSPCIQGVPPGASTGLSLAPLPNPPEPGGVRLCPFSVLETGTTPGAKQLRHTPELWPRGGLGCTGLPERRASGPGLACPPALCVTASGLAQISRHPVSADLGASQAPLGAAGLGPGRV